MNNLKIYSDFIIIEILSYSIFLNSSGETFFLRLVLPSRAK